MDRLRNARGSSKSVDPAIDATGKNLWWKIVAQLNEWLNPGHAWTDYQSKNDSMVDSWLRSQSGFSLTNAEQEANAFSAAEAQKQRDWEEQMSNTSYQRQVADMRAAGVNPALSMNGAGASTPSGSSATSVSPSAPGLSFSDLMQLLMLPMQKKLLQSQAAMYRDQGEAALRNAGANERNAGTNERNAGTNERNAESQARAVDVQQFNAETDRMRYDLEKMRTDKQLQVSDAELGEIAERTAYLKLQREYMPTQIDIAKQQADASTKQALAALESASAAVRNAAVNEKLSDAQEAVLWSQKLINWYEGEGKRVVVERLPERLQVEIDNMRKEGVHLDARGRLVDKQGKLVNAQTWRSWVDIGTSIMNALPGPPLTKGGSSMNADMVGSIVSAGGI